MLFLRRALQGISASAIWIVGLATIANAVGEEHMGKIMGVVNYFVTAGVILGPVVSGLLLRIVGYWDTWVALLVVLGLDMMIENPQGGFKSADSPSAASIPKTLSEDTARFAEDNAAAVTGYQSTSNTISIFELAENDPDLSTSSSAFYHAMLTNGRVVSALLISSATSSVLNQLRRHASPSRPRRLRLGPLRYRRDIFLSRNPPCTHPLSGQFRDRIDARLPPNTLGLLAVLLWLLGVSEDESSPWARAEIPEHTPSTLHARLA